MRKENPSSFEKLIPVLGDISLEDLGLSKIERQKIIEQVSVIFHIAANVRFEGNLKNDIFSNVRSTKDICILAKNMKNLAVSKIILFVLGYFVFDVYFKKYTFVQVLVHVSTAYAHIDKPVIDEIVYPPLIDWRNVIKMVESLDEQIVQVFTSK